MDCIVVNGFRRRIWISKSEVKKDEEVNYFIGSRTIGIDSTG
jgi:DNA polymerase III alpha subunit (gram-positive type)